MPLNIKNAEVERLAAELALISGSSKTEVIRQALLDRREKMALRRPVIDRHTRLVKFLETEIWPGLPEGASRRFSKEEEEAVLGYGPNGEPV